uniref:DUF4502 domain-containing protein n=1 Tax=Nothoprocta perdicaria TaxID=30464 RepID=A0A8C6YZZ2_NOTPE
ISCASFPDETPLQLKKSNVRASVAGTSISNSWLRCGDGFQSTSVLEESEDIIWSSSGSDFSDDEKTPSISRLCNEKSHTSKAEKSYSRPDLLSEDRSGEGKVERKQICQEVCLKCHNENTWRLFEQNGKI